jgi:hypothetical protein
MGKRESSSDTETSLDLIDACADVTSPQGKEEQERKNGKLLTGCALAGSSSEEGREEEEEDVMAFPSISG